MSGEVLSTANLSAAMPSVEGGLPSVPSVTTAELGVSVTFASTGENLVLAQTQQTLAAMDAIQTDQSLAAVRQELEGLGGVKTTLAIHTLSEGRDQTLTPRILGFDSADEGNDQGSLPTQTTDLTSEQDFNEEQVDLGVEEGEDGQISLDGEEAVESDETQDNHDDELSDEEEQVEESESDEETQPKEDQEDQEKEDEDDEDEQPDPLETPQVIFSVDTLAEITRGQVAITAINQSVEQHVLFVSGNEMAGQIRAQAPSLQSQLAIDAGVTDQTVELLASAVDGTRFSNPQLAFQTFVAAANNYIPVKSGAGDPVGRDKATQVLGSEAGEPLRPTPPLRRGVVQFA